MVPQPMVPQQTVPQSPVPQSFPQDAVPQPRTPKPELAPAAAPEAAPLVLVMVGTDHHPFGRLVDWADDWLASRPGGQVQMVIQHGRTHSPRCALGRDFIPRAELDLLLGQAAVVVCHGGPSTIVETRRRGLVPIVLARSAALGEHVDDHQQRFATAMGSRGLIRLTAEREALLSAMDEAIASPLLVGAGEWEADPGVSALRLGGLVDDRVAGRAGAARSIGRGWGRWWSRQGPAIGRLPRARQEAGEWGGARPGPVSDPASASS
jgi:UDP-N-acetylglucosamine transferase subunit ALG13